MPQVIPVSFDDPETLVPSALEKHHEISQDVRHKIDLQAYKNQQFINQQFINQQFINQQFINQQFINQQFRTQSAVVVHTKYTLLIVTTASKKGILPP
jgi:hypothetical protein